MDEWAAEFEYGLSTQAVSFKMGLDARGRESKAGGWRPEGGGLEMEARGWRSEAESQRLGVRGWIPEINSCRPEAQS